MRHIAFSLTVPQMESRSKTVTRRIGWADLKPGDRLQAVEKGQGLKKGEKVQRLYVIECVSNTREEVAALLDYADPQAEVNREGFPDMNAHQFVDFFCKANKCEWFTKINRIEFNEVK